MFDELKIYNFYNYFVLTPNDRLSQVCNAPTDKSGIYIIYSLQSNRKELIYIGSSGKKNTDGRIEIRKAGCGGLKDRLVNGKQFGERRSISWIKKMKTDNIESLEIHWYITHDTKIQDCPVCIERKVLLHFKEMHGILPIWNKELPKNCKHI